MATALRDFRDARGNTGDWVGALHLIEGLNDLRKLREIVEIIAHVALNLFTNYINVALNVPVDFPAVKLRKVA